MYRSSYKCTDCKHTFEKITKNFPKREPACPMCKQAKRVNFKSSVSDVTHNLDKESVVQEMIAAQKPPSMGQSNRTKAIDETAKIVMEDYGMTDINMSSSLRAGDNCVPKLAPELEQKVDQVFKPQPNKVMGMQGASELNKALLRQVNSGMYKNQGDPIHRATENIQRRPTDVMYHYNDKPTGKPN